MEVIARSLAHALGGQWDLTPLQASGFCSTWRARSQGERLFVKSMPAASAGVLEAEADGLAALAGCGAVCVPTVAACACEDGVAMLALEWLALHPLSDGAGLGCALATLHRCAPPEGEGRFGWRRDNMIGGTPQRNRWSAQGGRAGWVAFFGRERLGALRERLDPACPLSGLLAEVIAALPAFFDDGHVPRASLIHGDLWQGNWAALADGTPVLYDPAVSCSDAEAELAMMELFGTPPAGFWPAYREAAGLHPGYARRRGVYQLYHVVNHALLFGGAYARQAEQMARALLR